MISNRKIILIFVVFFVVLSSLMAVSANDDANVTDIAESDMISQTVYVGLEGDDQWGNGSFDSPYLSISYAVGSSSNNSRIVLKEGVYKGNLNTGVIVDKDVTIESESGGVTIDGEGKNYFFKIAEGSSVVLNNIKFVNGLADSYVQLGVINNQGKLLVNNSSFDSMKTVMSAFFNEGNLVIDNVKMTKCDSQNIANAVVNLGNCTISNSQFTDLDSNSLNPVYNFKNINIVNSKFSSLVSNAQYDEANYKNGFILIQNSTLNTIELENASCRILSSSITSRAYFKNMAVFAADSVFRADSSWTVMSVFYSNFTAKSCLFKPYVSADHSNLNITYSVILDTISGSGRTGSLYAPHNWWGINTGPTFIYFNNNSVDDWAVLTFEAEDNNLSVGTHSKFMTSFKWYDGNSTSDFMEGESLPYRPVRFESQNGRFLYSSGNLANTFDNYLLDNVLDCNVFAVVDNQRSALTIGKGLSAYTYFVSPSGTNTPESGSLEKPFKTIKYAIDMAGNGNTICLLEGTYRNNANSEISVEKNITLVGIGNVKLSRANDKTMFYVMEWGSLTIVNAQITISNDEYHNNIFSVIGGNLTLVNCNVYDVKSNAVISASEGNQNNAIVNIVGSRFSNIIGAAVAGSARIHINNSTFERISNYYTWRGVESFNAVFPVTSYIEIFNSAFKDNTVGIVNLHPFYYSSSAVLGVANPEPYYSGRYAYIVNSTFTSNTFSNMQNSYASNGIGLDIHDSYGSFNGCIVNCTFKSNKGMIAIVNQVISSSFIDNTGQAYGGNALIDAVAVDSSYFEGNLNQYRDGDGAYIGNGIVSAEEILNSTFIKNHASFGGAICDTKDVHYCVFVNNTARYAGNDIYSSSGDVDYSTNWWGDNQKPDSQNIFIFLGNLKLTDWIIMSFESRSTHVLEASLNKVMDNNGIIHDMDYSIPIRPVQFIADGANITPQLTFTSNNHAFANVSYSANSSDFKVYAKIDNQLMDVDVRNSNTRLVMEDVTVRGNGNRFDIDLININGYKIANQTLYVELVDENGNKQSFDILTYDDGHASFNIDYPIGKYYVNVNYFGNGFFEKCNASAKIEVLMSTTEIITYNYTYYGKNNKFYAIIHDDKAKNLANFALTFTITDSKGNHNTVISHTDLYGRADVILSLDLGEYDINVEFLGDSWYKSSTSSAHITIKPANTVLTLEDKTLYGMGNVYNITLKDIYGNLVAGENVVVTISQGMVSDRFTLTTDDKGIAGLTINYAPGQYKVKASYLGDNIYGASSGDATINIEKVTTVVSGFYHQVIPVNGIYTVVLSDIYGHRINNETITLKCYAGKLIKTFKGITDANGEVAFAIDLEEGTYLATIDFDGSLWYSDATNGATIVISKSAVLKSIHINSTNMIQYYGENKFFIIEFNDPNAYSQYGKAIVATISSPTWSKAYNVYTDAFGIARLQIKLDTGEYFISYKYSNPYYNIFGNGSNKIIVYRMPLKALGSDLIIKTGETRVYEVAIRDANNNPVKNLQVKMEINGEKHVVSTNDRGIASMLLDLNMGEYDVKYSVDNPNYVAVSGSSKIMVVDSDRTSTQIICSDAEAYDNEPVNLTVELLNSVKKAIPSSRLSLEILTFDGESIQNLSQISDGSGKATFKINLESGEYIYKVSYSGNNIYLPSSHLNTINILSMDNRTRTILFKADSILVKDQKYHVVLSDANGTLLAGKKISFIVGNDTYAVVTDNLGKAYLNVNLTPNKYDVKVIFEGDNTYRPVSSSVKLVRLGSLVQLHAQKLVKYYLNGTQFHARLTDEGYFPLVHKTVSVVLQNTTYNCTTDENGWITLRIDLKPGHYDVECYYRGLNESEYAFDKTTVDILSTIIGQNEVKYYGQNPYMTFKFLNGAGELIRNAEFVIGIDGKNYVAKTDGEGLFNLTLDLDSGEHMISLNNPYDGYYMNYTLNILPTIQTNPIVKVLGDGRSYLISLLDSNGNALSNSAVDIIINGIKYSKKSDASGEIKLDMELKPKNYRVTVINPKTGEYVEKIIKVLYPISGNKDLKMYYGSGSKFTVRILGAGGKPVGPGKTVTFTINGKKYTSKTNKYGYASLKIKLKPNTYKITVKYKKYTVTNKIKVKPVLITTNIKQKAHKVKFTAKLVNIKGKALSGKKVKFMFKNKKYVAKTNSKGIATIKLTLKKGKYSIISTYGKSKNTNFIVIKK